MICLKQLFTGRSRFSIIKERARYYTVTMSGGLFGNWHTYGAVTVTLLAFSKSHAVKRARKRGLISAGTYCNSYSNKTFGTYKVRRADRPDNHRFNSYFT